MIFGGIVIGAVIVGGWYVSGPPRLLAEDPATLEEKFVATNSGRAESFSYTAPLAYLLELLIYWTDQSRVLTFGIAGVLGMLVGSAAMAIATRTFRWEGFTTTEDLVNHVAGGILMGFGGVTALGVYDRAGPLRRVDAGAGLLPRGGRESSSGALRRSSTRCGGWITMNDPHAHYVRCPPRGRTVPLRAAERALMIIFDLTCGHGHRFEGWFASADDFEQQAKAVLVRCPVCDDASVVRVPSAKVHVGRATADAPRVAEEAEAETETVAGPARGSREEAARDRAQHGERRPPLSRGSAQDPLRGSPAAAHPRPGVEGRRRRAARGRHRFRARCRRS